MAPTRLGDGTDIDTIRLGDGTEIADVRTGAGDTVFSAARPRKQDVEYAYLGAQDESVLVFQDVNGNGDFDFSNRVNTATEFSDPNLGIFIAPFSDNPKKGYNWVADNVSTSEVQEFTFTDPALTDVSLGPTYDFVNIAWGSYGSGLNFSRDGLTCYIGGGEKAIDQLEVFTLSEPFDLSPSSRVSSTVVSGFDTGDGHMGNILFNPDGTKLFHGTRSDDFVAEYDLSTPFDVSSRGPSDKFFPGPADPLGVLFNAAGDTLYTYHHSPSDVVEHNLNTPYDISSISSSSTLKPDGEIGNMDGIASYNQNHFR